MGGGKKNHVRPKKKIRMRCGDPEKAKAAKKKKSAETTGGESKEEDPQEKSRPGIRGKFEGIKKEAVLGTESITPTRGGDCEEGRREM